MNGNIYAINALGLLRDSTKGSILDKARLLLIVSSVAFAEQGGGASKLLIEELDAVGS